jgi:hypothetical protein
MGQGILVMAGSVLLLALLLLIPLVAGGAVAGIGFRLGVAWALPPGAGFAAALIAMEVWFVVMWLGRVWDQTERIAPE